jgi:hypothetical protein
MAVSGMKLRIMVSSVVNGFEAERQAARRGIEAGGGSPLLVNEDFPAMGTSPRNACLDAVDSSDAYLVILGARAGYTAPSGKPVVEEEYEQAVARGLPVLAFVQEGVEREAEAARLEKRVSEYVGGHFRSTFTNTDELRDRVAAAVSEVVGQLRNPAMEPTVVDHALQDQPYEQREALLRTVFAPVRSEEVIDTVEIGRDTFHEDVVGLATQKEVGLFSAWHGKEAQLRGDSLTIRQDPGNSPPFRYAKVQLSPNGLLVVESNVTGRVASERGVGILGLQVLEGDVTEVLRQQFSFACRLYDHVDRFQRQHAVNYNSALLGAAHRSLAREPAAGGAVRMSMRGDGPITVHPQARQIGRAVLAAPQPEIERTLELLRRRMRD